MTDPVERDLQTLASGGDQEAFGALYEIHVNRIYTYIYYRTGNQHDAEDLTARVFIRAMNHINTYQDQGLPFSAWLYRIAHNLVANWHRDNQRRQEISLDAEPGLQVDRNYPEDTLLHSEAENQLLGVIRSLPTDRQQLLILKHVDSLSNAEIGSIMGRTEGAIKSLYHRTLLELRDQLTSQLVTDGPAGEAELDRKWLKGKAGGKAR
ncbi:MAG TPA: sigma-70 family RNA polymerase sigma factor [Anaerolineales bacterium]|nr:sigma-70 family RNA polymerase sigma factor [Anaerolineales bacterium]